MEPSVRCVPVDVTTDCTYKYCEHFVHAAPIQLPGIPVATRWTNRPAFVPAMYTTIAEQVANFEVRPDDVWVVTFPKSGTTWTMEMVRMLHTDLDYELAAKVPNEMAFGYFEGTCIFNYLGQIKDDPYYAIDTVRRADARASPRLFKTHLPIQLLPKAIWTVRPKIIYTARNPKDTAISLFHHYRNLQGYRGDQAAFLRAFLADEVMFGPCGDHVLNFWRSRHEENILFLTYEAMKQDLGSVLRRTQEFLGKSFDDAALARLSAYLHVDAMRLNGNANNTMLTRKMLAIIEEDVRDKEFRFLRKGVSGTFKTEMAPSTIELFDAKTQRIFEGSDFKFDM